jgi:hypothetical protein
MAGWCFAVLVSGINVIGVVVDIVFDEEGEDDGGGGPPAP